jgi:hypothetical protein
MYHSMHSGRTCVLPAADAILIVVETASDLLPT